MYLGYNTNGLAHHDPLDAISLLADLGYRGIALTLDHGCMNPFGAHVEEQFSAVARALARHEFRSVIETGARFLLDPRVKHEPTLVSADSGRRARRVEFLCRAIDIAARLGSDCVSLWAGVLRDQATEEEAFTRLVDGLRQVVDHAERRDVVLGFEPEPGMFIDTMAKFVELRRRIDSPRLQLTLDVGHLHCQGEVPIAGYIRTFAQVLVNVHIEDMRAGVHEHLMFGEGEMEFAPILAALAEVGYEGGVYVELSRHSHDGPAAATHAANFLKRYL